MEQLQITQLTPQQLKEEIQNAVSDSLNQLKTLLQPQQNEEYLTRQEVADLFKVSLVTIYHWTKKGQLKSYGIGTKVYYLKTEVDKSLIALNE